MNSNDELVQKIAADHRAAPPIYEDRNKVVKLRRDRGFEPKAEPPKRSVGVGELALLAVVAIILVCLLVSMVRVKMDRDLAMAQCQADGHKAYECRAIVERQGDPDYIPGLPAPKR